MTRPLLICLLMASTEEGGLERHLVDLANGLCQFDDLALQVICDPKYASRFKPQVQVHPIAMHRSRKNPLLLWQLARTLRALNPTIVHAQANKATALLAAIRTWVPGIKLASLHSLKKSLGPFAKMDHLVAVSRRSAKTLSGPPVTVIYNGITPPDNTQHYPRSALCAELHLSDQRPLCLAAGMLREAKGFDLLIQAWRGIDANLLIAGNGPDRQELQAQIDQLGLGERVKLLGHRSDVETLLASVDMAIISSRREGFPYFAVEALLLGKVLAATPVSDLPELLPQGWQMDCNPSAMQKTINELLQQPTSDEERKVFQWAQDQLSLQAMLARYHQLYLSLCGEQQ